MSSPPLPNPFSNDRLTNADEYDPALDVPSVHEAATTYLEQAILRIPKLRQPDGKAKVAALLSLPGLGKTHVIGRVQHRFGDRALFVFVPQVEEHGSPIKHVHWHLLKRLFDSPPGERPLLHKLLARLCQHSFRRYFEALPHTVKEKHKPLRERLENQPIHPVLEIVDDAREPGPFLGLAHSIANRCPALHEDVLRALVLGWSSSCNDDAWRWLRGDQVEEKRLAELHLPNAAPTTTAVLQTLTGLLHRLQIPVVICCDQAEKLLKYKDAMNDLTTALMGWVDSIPNLVLAITCLKDDWKKLNESFQSFCDRAYPLMLNSLDGSQAVELISKRMAGWPGAQPEKGPVWPFREEDIIQLTVKGPVPPRGLLKRCGAGLEIWLAKRSQQTIDLEKKITTPPLEELLRQEWNLTLNAIRNEQLAPEKLQEERLFRAIRESLAQLQGSNVSVSGLDLLQIQEGAVSKHFSLQVKLGVKGTNHAIPVVIALTKLMGGLPLTGFLRALEQAVDDPIAGSVLVRPTAKMTLNGKAEGKKIFDKLKSAGKLRLYDLAEHRSAFEQMECYLRLLDRAGQKELQLSQQTVTPDQFRQLATKTKILEGLDLFETIFAGWSNSPLKAGAPPHTVSGTTPAPGTPSVGGSVSAGLRQGVLDFHVPPNALSVGTPVSAGPKPSIVAVPAGALKPVAVALPPIDAKEGGDDWANRLLRLVSDKLVEFGQKVEPIGVQIGPTFARLKLKPLGRTSIGKVRNHANDLRTHIATISDVPVISDQPGFISVDVKRPDRQVVRLTDHLTTAPPDLAQKPAFLVGVDVTGKPYWLNLAEPSTCHILAAGTTGSGKSEFLKAMIASLAARLSSLELQFILIDPKHVTFNLSGKSPYLLHPVAHTVDEALPLVQECFTETERRYKLLQEKGLEHVGQLKGKDALSRIVVIFDEFADLMAEPESRRELESSLKRIGALARAAGIHLVLATQRPDKDVVTPLLKANLPTRICLRVDGERNSKIILDEEGGENLLGNGDLFWKHGSGMIRLQGAFVQKSDLERLLRIEYA